MLQFLLTQCRGYREHKKNKNRQVHINHKYSPNTVVSYYFLYPVCVFQRVCVCVRVTLPGQSCSLFLLLFICPVVSFLRPVISRAEPWSSRHIESSPVAPAPVAYWCPTRHITNDPVQHTVTSQCQISTDLTLRYCRINTHVFGNHSSDLLIFSVQVEAITWGFPKK